MSETAGGYYIWGIRSTGFCFFVTITLQNDDQTDIMSSQTRNIVILGASFGGLGAAHYTAKHILPKLQLSKDAQYVLHLVDSSEQFWWHIAAPRQIVSVDQIKLQQSFVPIMGMSHSVAVQRGSR